MTAASASFAEPQGLTGSRLDAFLDAVGEALQQEAAGSRTRLQRKPRA